jgi:hypothetical protein
VNALSNPSIILKDLASITVDTLTFAHNGIRHGSKGRIPTLSGYVWLWALWKLRISILMHSIDTTVIGYCELVSNCSNLSGCPFSIHHPGKYLLDDQRGMLRDKQHQRTQCEVASPSQQDKTSGQRKDINIYFSISTHNNLLLEKLQQNHPLFSQ